MVDTFAHGAIGYLATGRKKNAFLAVLFGMLPDLMSWTIYLIYNLFRGGFGRPVIEEVPKWVFVLYGISHSLFVFAAVIGIVYLIKKKIPIYLWAWFLHIIVDFPTHSREFLPTPFLWPINWYFPGISWGKLFPWYWIAILAWAGYAFYADRKNKKTPNISKKKPKKK